MIAGMLRQTYRLLNSKGVSTISGTQLVGCDGQVLAC